MAVAQKEALIEFFPEKCTQCHGCEIACKSWRDLPYGIHYRKVLNLWEGHYPGIKNASLALSCLHCVEPACMAACPEEAIAKRNSDGLVLVDQTLCTGCQICADACPFGVPQFENDGIMQKCDLCCDQPLGQAAPPCVDTCPGGALAIATVSPSEKKTHEEKIAWMLRIRSSAP
jgi:anaerobic dimethyl sulfoxide reductase subunit B (iron-sulfur subunit)